MTIPRRAALAAPFLLAAVQKLMDYHLAYYAEHPKEGRLSVAKKAEILANSIFGVDIDPQMLARAARCPPARRSPTKCGRCRAAISWFMTATSAMSRC